MAPKTETEKTLLRFVAELLEHLAAGATLMDAKWEVDVITEYIPGSKFPFKYPGPKLTFTFVLDQSKSETYQKALKSHKRPTQSQAATEGEA